MSVSTYKGLELPKSNERYSIEIVNKNNRIIDSELHRLDLKNESQDELLAAKEAQITNNLSGHISDTANPHGVTKEQLNLNNVDNTSDINKPVSTAQQEALDAFYQQSTGYTDQKIADLINGAPSTLDTLGEIADAMENNNGVVEALDAAIGSKANQAEMESWLGTKLDTTGDSKDNEVTFNSSDTLTPSGWTDVAVLKSGETHMSILAKISSMFKNMRYLWKLLGSTDISALADGTVTGAINQLNTGLENANGGANTDFKFVTIKKTVSITGDGDFHKIGEFNFAFPDGYTLVSATIVSNWDWAVPGFSGTPNLNNSSIWVAYCFTKKVDQIKTVTFTAMFTLAKQNN